MPEPQDPLRSLFRQAADSGRQRAVTAPAEHITERGRRAHRRRVTLAVVGVCLVLAGGGAAVSELLPGKPAPTPPATTPSPGQVSPGPTTRPPSPAPTTGPPAARTSLPPAPPATSPYGSTRPPDSSATGTPPATTPAR
ncbi:hypothetical protein KPP03845_107104 [Streptomyces xanthophaeus]|uniref:hypothetical protein n=1 Tax=Streptomyces xanthophaeus TaxID=67385 RepID=UPI00233ECC55|nr:hypothetical protein [Streptomyces xanthophaeus]WCD90676.1 hypothetical protein KPP03845_107104 [Streptomyces xanthophaeus]